MDAQAGAAGAEPGRIAVHLYLTGDAQAGAQLPPAAHVSGAALATYAEGAPNGAARPALDALLAACRSGDILLVMSIAALGGLPARARGRVVAAAKRRGVRIVALDVPASLRLFEPDPDPALVHLMCDMIGDLVLMASEAAKPVRSRRRQADGPVEPAVAGREADILKLLNEGKSWSHVQRALGVPYGQVARLARRLATIESAQSQARFIDAVAGAAPPRTSKPDGSGET